MPPSDDGAALESEEFPGRLSRAARGAGSRSVTTVLIAFAANLLVAVAKSVAGERVRQAVELAGLPLRGSETVYAFMQNVGMLNDLVHGCFRATDYDQPLTKARRP